MNDDDVKEAKQAKKQRPSSDKSGIRIPPGHWMVFYQNLIHEVVSTTMKYDALRLYVGCRLTETSDSLFSDVNKKYFMTKSFSDGYNAKTFNFSDLITEQGVPPLPSGMHPPMYAKLNTIFEDQRNKLVEWSNRTFKSECMSTIDIKGVTYPVVDRYLLSLKEYEYPLYPEYLQIERDILQPSNVWILPLYGKRISVKLNEA